MPDSKFGNLIVPNGVEILYVEPAVLYEVKDASAKFYSAPPVNNDKNNPLSENGLNITPDTIKYDPSNIEKQILARDFYYPDPVQPGKLILHPYLKQVALYKREKKGSETLHESGNEITVKEIGYMYARDIEPVETFRASENALFETEPNINQVNQSWMGNCFYLSSIMAIANTGVHKVTQQHSQGLDFIKNMMCQQTDGSVIVRLYDPRTLQPVYVKVQGSEHYKSDRLAHKHHAYWIHILEKAYAGFAFKCTGEKFQLEFPSFLSMYGKGGRPEVALSILTGKRAVDIKLQKTPEDAFNPFTSANLFLALHPVHRVLNQKFLAEVNDEWNNLLSTQSMQLSVSDGNAESKKIKQTTFEAMFELASQATAAIELTANLQAEENTIFIMLGQDENLYKQWAIFNFVLQHADIEKYMQFNDQVSQLSSSKESLLTYLRTQLPLFEPTVPKAVIDKFEQHIESSRVEAQPAQLDRNNENVNTAVRVYTVDGKAGTGEYSPDSLKIFNDIKKSMEAGHLLTASTPDRFQVTGVGLRNTHAYTITDVKKENIDGKDICFVTVRNPWGKVGRIYDKDWTPKEDHSAAESRLDLCDFVALFESYSVGALPTPAELITQLDTVKANIERSDMLLYRCAIIDLKNNPVKVVNILDQVMQHPANLMKFLTIQRTHYPNENEVKVFLNKEFLEKEITELKGKNDPANAKKIQRYERYIKQINKMDNLINLVAKRENINFGAINYDQLDENNLLRVFSEYNATSNLEHCLQSLDKLNNENDTPLKKQLESLLLDYVTKDLKNTVKTSPDLMRGPVKSVLAEINSKSAVHLDTRTKIEVVDRTNRLIKEPGTNAEYKTYITSLPKLPLLRRIKRAMEGLLRITVNAFTVGIFKTASMPYSISGIYSLFDNPLKRKMRSFAHNQESVNKAPKRK